MGGIGIATQKNTETQIFPLEGTFLDAMFENESQINAALFVDTAHQCMLIAYYS